MNRRPATLVVVAALGLTLLLAACGSSKSSRAGASASTSSSTTTSTSSHALTKSPLKAVFINDTATQTGLDAAQGIKIGVDAVNAAGGVDGHPIKVTSCTLSSPNPNQTASCGRSAVSDSSVLATVGTVTSYGSSLDPILQSAQMASIGAFPLTQADFTCSVCFYNNAGSFGSIGSALPAVSVLHAKKIGVPYIDLPAGATEPPLLAKLLKPLGAGVVGAVPIDVEAADVSPQAAAESAAHPDAIIDALTTALLTKFIHAYRSLGAQTPIVLDGAAYDPHEVATQLAGVTSNLYVATEFNHSAPGYATFLSDFHKYDPSYTDHNDEVLAAYLGVKQFAYAAAHAKHLTRAGVLAAMKSLTFNTDGLTPPISYKKPQTALGGAVSRIIPDTIWLDKYESGAFVPIQKAGINAFTGATQR